MDPDPINQNFGPGSGSTRRALTVTDLNQGMELFDHAVLYEKCGIGHQFYSKALELTTSSFQKNSIVEPVPFLSEGQSQA